MADTKTRLAPTSLSLEPCHASQGDRRHEGEGGRGGRGPRTMTRGRGTGTLRMQPRTRGDRHARAHVWICAFSSILCHQAEAGTQSHTAASVNFKQRATRAPHTHIHTVLASARAAVLRAMIVQGYHKNMHENSIVAVWCGLREEASIFARKPTPSPPSSYPLRPCPPPPGPSPSRRAPPPQ